MNNLRKLYKFCKNSGSNFWIVAFRYLLFKLQGKSIIAHQRAIIRGTKNITIGGLLRVGVDPVGFMHHKDFTYLNIQGTLNIKGKFFIGRGCRLDVGPFANIVLGHGSSINSNGKIIIMHGLSIGEDCAIAWNCNFLDEDFHQINYEGKRECADPKILIEDHVWIGANVSIYKGVKIARGSVVAANSVVVSQFEEENVLIAGNPACVIKRNVNWK